MHAIRFDSFLSPLHGLTVRTELEFAVCALQSPLMQCFGVQSYSCVWPLSLCHDSQLLFLQWTLSVSLNVSCAKIQQ